jgi:alpha-1,3-mannosyltransferase
MQEVGECQPSSASWLTTGEWCGFLGGQRDYALMRGDTGPLVYPAGFVYVYSILHYVTSAGAAIKLAQFIFLGIYLAVVRAVFTMYDRARAGAPPQWAFLLLCASKRIHSIFVLRLFNDPISMLFVFYAIHALISDRYDTAGR